MQFNIRLNKQIFGSFWFTDVQGCSISVTSQVYRHMFQYDVVPVLTESFSLRRVYFHQGGATCLVNALTMYCGGQKRYLRTGSSVQKQYPLGIPKVGPFASRTLALGKILSKDEFSWIFRAFQHFFNKVDPKQNIILAFFSA